MFWFPGIFKPLQSEEWQGEGKWKERQVENHVSPKRKVFLTPLYLTQPITTNQLHTHSLQTIYDPAGAFKKRNTEVFLHQHAIFFLSAAEIQLWLISRPFKTFVEHEQTMWYIYLSIEVVLYLWCLSSNWLYFPLHLVYLISLSWFFTLLCFA